MAEPFSLQLAVLVAAAVLFFPPLALLGMISPYAVRLKASGIDVVGRTAGDLYAVSTIAGVAAALLTGFFLIPNVGVSRMIVGIGLLLVGTSLVGLLGRRNAAIQIFILLVTAGTITAAGVYMPQQGIDPASGIRFIEESPYAEIRVIDMNGMRFLLIDGTPHTIINLETGRTAMEYVNVVDIAKNYFEIPGRLLLVGLGGGSVVEHFARDGWSIDVVEIDPVVTRAAFEQFGLSRQAATYYCGDGRAFLAHHDTVYDLIILDAFGSSSIPFQLVTREAFALVSSRLRDGGIMAVNIAAPGWHDVIVRSLAATIATGFEHVLAFPISEPPNTLGNLVLVASNRSLDLPENREPSVPIDRTTPGYDRFHAWENRFQPDTRDALVLTDERNPIDVWSETLNVASRNAFHEYFGNRGIDW
jgi:spermidine synthase